MRPSHIAARIIPERWLRLRLIAKRVNCLITAVTARIASLRQVHTKRHNVTVDSLIAELEEARIAALTAETVQASAATAATMGKAKLMGLDKQLVQLSGGLDNVNTNINITAEDVKVFKKAFNDEF